MFFSTKHSAHRAKILFGLAGLPPAAELHGNMTQAARLESLEKFRKVTKSSNPLRVSSLLVVFLLSYSSYAPSLFWKLDFPEEGMA